MCEKHSELTGFILHLKKKTQDAALSIKLYFRQMFIYKISHLWRHRALYIFFLYTHVCMYICMYLSIYSFINLFKALGVGSLRVSS